MTPEPAKEAMPDDKPTSPEQMLKSSISQVPPVDPVMPRPGELFAERYEIERMIGRGGMGEVYAAVQRPLERRVAVKILKTPESIDDDPQFQARFLREAAAAARLTHPNTITVFDFGQTKDGVLFIVMEYLEGNDVRTVLRHEGQIAPQRAIHVAKQVCKSLREAHRKGIVHRDLKPANVLLVNRDEDPDFAKVLDFGLVKVRGESSEITLAGKFLGSPRYTSPEALDRNREVDHRADIYAVGILLYTMIVGEPPFDGDPMQVLNAHLHETPQLMYKAAPSARTTPELEDVVTRCLRKEPEHRFQSMSDLLTALRTVGSYYGDHDTETIDFDTEDSLELDDSVSPDQAVHVLAPFAGDATLKSTGKMRAVESLDRPEAGPPPVVPPKVEPASALPPPRATPPPKTKSGPMLGLAIGGLIGAGLLFWALTSSPTPTPAPELGTPVAPESTPELPPERTPEATLERTPEATPKPTPRPVVKPAPVPRPTPAPVVKPKPTPKPESTPDTTVPGYKDNPYGD